jgi:RNA polymerase sigma-70 factor (ECF subfamily)
VIEPIEASAARAANRLWAARGAVGTAATQDLERVIAGALHAAPEVDPDALADEIDRCVDRDVGLEDLPAAIEKLHLADLALALRCRLGDAVALRRFEREHIGSLGPAIGRIDASAAFIDEVRQRVRTKLLVPAGAGKLVHYTGKGELGTWVRVVAVREAIDMRRGPGRDVGDDALADLPESATGPEIGIVKHEYRERFAAAFTAALDALGPAQRNLLRLHYLHGVGIDELGGLLSVHRSSAARRIEKARKELLALTRRRLEAELAIGRPELRQLMDMIASRLDLSLERFLER